MSQTSGSVAQPCRFHFLLAARGPRIVSGSALSVPLPPRGPGAAHRQWLSLVSSTSSSRPGGRASSVELAFFGRTGQRRRRRGRVHGRGDPVEVAGANLALVFRRGVTPLLGGELALLQLDV